MSADPVKRACQTGRYRRHSGAGCRARGCDKFYRRIWWRNAIEYIACAIVVIGFGTYLFTLPHVLQKAGSMLVIAGTLFVAWQLHRRDSAESPEKAGTTPLLLFARAQLVRQRDALAWCSGGTSCRSFLAWRCS